MNLEAELQNGHDGGYKSENTLLCLTHNERGFWGLQTVEEEICQSFKEKGFCRKQSWSEDWSGVTAKEKHH